MIATVDRIAYLVRDLHGIRHDLARLASTLDPVGASSLLDAVDMIDGAIVRLDEYNG